MWLESEFPGVRLLFRLGLRAIDQELSIDVGFNDPLVPATVERDISGDRIRVVRPETQLAWKLHALAEMTTSWRPKDLGDMRTSSSRTCQSSTTTLVPAIAAAFQSRGFSRASATQLFDAAHWPTKTSRLRWDKQTPPLADAVAAVRTRLAPVFERLPVW